MMTEDVVNVGIYSKLSFRHVDDRLSKTSCAPNMFIIVIIIELRLSVFRVSHSCRVEVIGTSNKLSVQL